MNKFVSFVVAKVMKPPIKSGNTKVDVKIPGTFVYGQWSGDWEKNSSAMFTCITMHIRVKRTKSYLTRPKVTYLTRFTMHTFGVYRDCGVQKVTKKVWMTCQEKWQKCLWMKTPEHCCKALVHREKSSNIFSLMMFPVRHRKVHFVTNAFFCGWSQTKNFPSLDKKIKLIRVASKGDTFLLSSGRAP